MPLQGIPFCGATYTDKTLVANAQEAINLYPMRTASAQASAQKMPGPQPESIVMYPTPGYKFAQTCALFATSAATPIRALYVINNILYIICGNTLLSFTPTGAGNNLTAGTFAVLGTLNTSTGICTIVCNTVQLAISDGQAGYTYMLTTGSFATIGSSGSFPASGGVTNFTYYDGYTVAALNASTQIIHSNVLDATTWGAQAFDKLTSFVDNIVAVFSDELQLYAFGPKLTEVQFDAGTIPYAFEKIAGVLIQAGCAAANSICKVGNTVMWLASDIAGCPYVAALQGFGTKPVSTPPINEALARYSTVSDAFGFSYREGDNHFYVITFPSANVTWAYDTKMDMWHKRSINGGADLPQAYIYWQGNHVVGDSNGNLLLMSQNYSFYSTYVNGVVKDYPLRRIRTCQHVTGGGMTLFIEELQIEMQVGYGFIADPNLATQPGADDAPLVTLEVSRDFGNTWVMVGTRTLGMVGNYMQRVIWRKLGRFRKAATFRLTITDPLATFIIGARADVKVGTK